MDDLPATSSVATNELGEEIPDGPACSMGGPDDPLPPASQDVVAPPTEETPKRKRRGATTLRLEDVIALRDVLQAVDDSKTCPSNLSYLVGRTLTEMRGLAFRMEKDSITEVKV